MIKKNFFNEILLFFTLVIFSNEFIYSQNIGIGSEVFIPKSPLHVHGDSAVGNLLQLTTTEITEDAFRGLIMRADSYSFNIINYESGNLIFGTNALERLRITSDGLIGINTNDITHRLTIRGGVETMRLIGPFSSGHGARLNFGDGNFVYIQEDNDNRLQIFGSERIALMGGNVGINTLNPSQRLHVGGNVQIDGFLRVGNAQKPSDLPSNTPMQLFRWTNHDNINAMQMSGNCGTAQWSYVAGGLNSWYLWDNLGSRSYTPLLTPWIWVPSDVTGIVVGLSFGNTLEAGNDGVYIQYTTDGVNWTTITTWESQGYNNANVAGSNSTCTANYGGPAWTNTGNFAPRSTVLPINGSWVRFRIIGVENATTNTGDFRLYGFTVWINSLGAVGGEFTAGNLYAERNVYAGSNVLLGDVAEFVKVEDITRPGMLISIHPNKPNTFILSKRPYDNTVVGVHSTSPTVTLNDPSCGIPLALAGRVPVWVSDENGKIKAGDYLTSSSLPGFAMKADRSCFVIGQALETQTEPQQLILSYLKPGWFNNVITQNMVAGNVILQKGISSIKIDNDLVTPNSNIVLTLANNERLNMVVSEKEYGSFVVSFNKPIRKSTILNYFVYGSLKEENFTQINDKWAHNYLTKEISIDNTFNYSKIDNEEQKTIFPVPIDDQLFPPPTPDIIENGYIWFNNSLVLTLNLEQLKKQIRTTDELKIQEIQKSLNQ